MIWLVKNGWMGNGWTTCIVEAPTKWIALELARTAFQQEDRSYGQHAKGEDYWRQLEAEQIETPYITEMG